MRAARYHGRRDVRVEDVDEPSPAADEVAVEVAACGICGSDLHEYAAGPMFAPDETPHPLTGETVPVTMGHEFGGIVTEVGSDVEELDEGDAVAVNPILWCGECQYCEEGNYHLCAVVGFLGLSGGGGGFAETAVVPAEQAVPFPADLPVEHAALVEPLSVALHAVRRSGLRSGDSVAVFGSGPIGLGVIQAARAAGPSDVVVSEPRATRRERARDSGATSVVDPTEEDPVERITAETGGVDVAFEVAGVTPTYNQAVRSTRRDGRVTVVSIFEDEVETQPNDIVVGERTVTGTIGYLGGPLSDREFGMTIDKLATGAFDPGPLVTDRVALDEVEGGFESLLEEDSDQVKVLVEP